MNKFNEFRNKYKNFIYDNYEVILDDNGLLIKQHYNIENLTDFNTELKINKEYITNKNIDINTINSLAFHIGLIELLSYYKATCSPNIIIKCGYLNSEQIAWFKKLYYNGLGEFFYRNNIDVTLDKLVNIKCLGKELEINNTFEGFGNLIPIGGGKDSIVTLEVLNKMHDNNTCFALNPKQVHLDCIDIGGYSNSKIIVNKTYIDSKIKELNSKGFLNGHTPFSSLLAFISYLTAYVSNKKYIVLSNEASANEATVIGTSINHQYSKSFEFEVDFNNYTNKYFNLGIKYFSLLRPLNEYTISYLFSKYEKYHKVFKSCNLGSRGDTWVWCLNCPKCLFVYTILSPFLYKDKLVNIFGEDLFLRKDLLDTFLELLGYTDTKPFECVGTYSEVRYAVSKTIDNLLKEKKELPYLLEYYYETYGLVDLSNNLLDYYNDENNLDEEFERILKENLNHE